MTHSDAGVLELDGPTCEWNTFKPYRCHISLTRDEDGTFSAIVLNLPGCGSCGDTVEEAVNNVREAIRGVIESHIAANEKIPWVNSLLDEIPKDVEQRWIVVNA